MAGMTNTEMLKDRIKESGYKLYHVAQLLGLSSYSFAKKVRNESEFKANEIAKLCGILKINTSDEINAIFFAKTVDFQSTDSKRVWFIWKLMLARCEDQKHASYKHYGARGIAVCEDWRADYIAFLDWAMENGYKDNLTLDRIDVNGNYEPSNCRWVTWEEQAKNKRPKNTE